MSYELIDVEDRHRKYPKTFEIPTREERCSLRAGDRAKLDFDGKERMWVEVCRSFHTGSAPHLKLRYEGKLLNKPVVVGLKIDARIEFGPEHVLRILREGEEV